MSESRDKHGGAGHVESGRRYVAVLFSDLCDSTALGEALDPEESIQLRQQVEHIMLEVVRKHGGSLSQVYGDGVLAVFGYPASQEDDARRAVEAAVELHEAIRSAEFGPSKPSNFELRLHSAVHAGRVFAREGDALHGQYELVGDAVNTAARLCDAATRDEILVSDEVLGGIEAFFVTEATSPLELKGKKAPVRVYRVRGRSDVETRFEARTSGGLSEFVGREAELGRLFELVMEQRRGPPRLALVSGAPGIGKSRILTELRRRVAASGTFCLHGSCESYGEMALLGPFLQILRQLFGLQSKKREAGAIERVEAHLQSLGPAAVSHLDTYLQLLGLRPWPLSSRGEAEQVQAAGALAALLAAVTSRGPLLMVLDDWQWADDASRTVLDQLRARTAAHAFCILVGSRPTSPPDPALAAVDTWTLQPFDEQASAKMIRTLRPDILDLGIARAIHARTGGSPLFLEELCRSLPADALVGERALEESAVSTTLHGLIQARVSRLPPAQARVLRAAAVIGNEFSPSLVPRAFPGSGVAEALEELTRGDLIREGDPSEGFRFKHGITREVIYESVRLGERREMHRAIAEAIADRAATEETAEQLEALAYHYRGCADHERAARYAELAGDRAQATSSLDRARLQYSTALAELDELAPCPELKRRWLAVHAKWAGVYVYSPSRAQLRILQQATEYAAELGDDSSRAYAGHWRCWMHYVLGEYGEAIEAASAALQLAERQQDGRLVAQLLASLGQCHAAGGYSDDALAFLERAIELKRSRAGGRRGASILLGFAYALGARASLLAHLGEFDGAKRDIREAQAAVRDSGHAIEGSVCALECMVHIYRGDWQACVDTAERCRAVAARVNSAYVFAMGSVFAVYGRCVLDPSPEALRELSRAVEWLEARDTGLYGSFTYGCLAEAFASAGELEQASDYARRALARRRQRDRLGEAMAHRALARVAHAKDGDGRGAEEEIGRALRAAQEHGSARDAAVTHLLRAELAADAGRKEEAVASARDAASGLERMGMRWHLQRAQILLTGG